ncbi:MAG TPA: sensor histidine kinase N-terminal domain-containing protein [Acidovorax sp.]|jgi:two-component system, OmpR family, sensor histidine kinase TctE|nr:sensor histidine kinase N-terminal domain-containing protein [Acidovorax sp.]
MDKSAQFSLRRRLLVRLWGPLYLVLILGSLGTIWLAKHVASVVYDRWLYDSAMTLAQQITHDGERSILDMPKAAKEMFEFDSVDEISEEVLSLKHGVLLHNADFPQPPRDLALNTPLFYDSRIGPRQVRIVAVRLKYPHDEFLIQVAQTKRKHESIIEEILRYAVPLLAIVLTLTGVVIWLAVVSGLRVIERFTRSLDRYEPQQLVPLDNVEGVPKELEPLLNALDQLIARVADSQDAQRRFIANAAHQLRTPLTTLQVQTERALRESDETRRVEALTHILTAVTRARHITHQLLTLARSERSGQPIPMTSVDLAELVRDELERWADAAIARHMDLGYDGPDHGVWVAGSPVLLRELIGNLVDNAIRYGRPGGLVTLGLRASPVAVTVDDDGPGISPPERLLVLERFYRGQEGQGDGCGLGLPIAKEIAARHGAALRILDHPQGQGTRIEVVFD